MSPGQGPEVASGAQIARIPLRRGLRASMTEKARSFDQLAERLTGVLLRVAGALPDSAPR